MGEAERLLAGADFFDCTRMGARLRRSICVARQRRTVVLGGHIVPAHPECAGCAQGAVHSAMIREEEIPSTARKRGAPAKKRKPGEKRTPPIPVVGGVESIGQAADAREKPMDSTKEAPRLCGDCGIRSATARRDGRVVNGLCGPCTYKRGAETIRRGESRAPERRREIRLDFSEYPALWEALQAEAHRELRLMPAQALWILRQVLTGGPGYDRPVS